MSGGIGFDPSREWLGIDAVDLADPFRALGLASDVSDPTLVTAAAVRLLERLRGVDPGPFKLAHESLVRRVEACRDEVLATVAARRPRFAPPPPPVPAGTTTLEPLASAAEREVVRVRRSARVRRKRPSGAPALLSVVALALTGFAAYQFWPRPGAKKSQSASQVAVTIPRPQSPTPAAPTQPSEQAPAVTTPPAKPVIPVPAPTDEPPAPVSPRPLPTPTTPPQPESPPAPPQPDPQARARAAAAVDEALRAAYEAIRADEFDTADRQVAAAAKLADDDEDTSRRVTCWRQFARYARQAADYREQALDAAHAGGDYDIGNQRIAVVESTPQRFVYHKDGRNVRISPRANVPAPIVTAILRSWFAAAERPGNHVFLGTHLLARSEPSARLAAAEWNRAGQEGEDVSNLEPLLKDPIIRGAAAE